MSVTLAVVEADDLVCLACALDDAKVAPVLYAHCMSVRRVNPASRCGRCDSPFGHGKGDVACADFLGLLEASQDPRPEPAEEREPEP